MNRRRKLGVWMDHSMAHLMEISTDPFEVQTIESNSQQQEAADSLALKKEKQLQRKYYKKIIQSIRDFYHVVLFGPTDAKNELYDLLSADQNFGKLKIEIKETNKMTSRQQQAFLKKYFASAKSN